MTPHRNLIIGTAGHIDHGKTVLVKALTGRDTDRLAEEKVRGISIDLGFAPLTLSDGSVVGIVDVPGHENFVRNMMAGATGVDLALLVVAADDGVMPQTREHLAILDLLGVTRGVVAVTKIDLVEEDLVPLVIEEIGELLQATALNGSPVLPVSAVTGTGIDSLKQELERAAGQVMLKDEALPPRLPIDRVFTLKGIGTVVTGTLWSGTLHAGDNLKIMPAGQAARVRNLQVHDSDREAARAGERVAVNLAGVSRSQVARGDVLTVPGYLGPTYMIDARITLLRDCPRPLKRGARLRFHHGTRELLGRIYPLEEGSINPGEERPAQLRLESRAVCAPGDRFVLRSYSPMTTIGGGTVVDAHPEKHRVKDPAALAAFKDLESADPGKQVHVYLSRADMPVSSSSLVLDSGLAPRQVEESLETLTSNGQAVKLGHQDPVSYLSDNRFSEAAEALQQALQRFHRENPLSEGMAKETLKKQVLASWDSRAAEEFIDGLAGEGLLESTGHLVRLPGASASVTVEQKEMIDVLVSSIEHNPVSPPTLGELASELKSERQLLSELLAIAEKQKRVVRVSPDLYYPSGALEQIETTLRESITEDGITISDFKNLIGTSRKYALPLLEYFDRMKLTVRVGDVRRLRR